MLGSLTSPDFRMGTKMENFQAVGKIPVTIDVFIMVVMWGALTGSESLMNLSGIPSDPHALLLLIFLIVGIRVCQSIGSGLNRLLGSVLAVGSVAG